MCIAAPARILEINDNMATVDFGGVRQQVKLDLVTDVEMTGTYWFILVTPLRYLPLKRLKSPWKPGMSF